ncbi:armadillo repeat-containing protein 6 homolog [Leptopilina boulardi]|uniref:armadillo repeat-containing protein 6 homolog n=1 Tax=Leptopilina boulardi TaxID=63433 RepID=UPI0021F52619|nr:armadillo repeat-containing protein 6 homolog [Leptopilina boulardi]
MVRVISQQTYDDVVQENINEFEMSPEEAITEAIKEFEAQGVDLSNIIKDLAINDDSVILSCLEKLSACLSEEEYDSAHSQLEKLKNELDKDIARRIYAAKHDAYSILTSMIKKCKDNPLVIKSALKTITSLMTGHPDLLDERGISLQIEILETVDDTQTLQCLLKWIKECCIKHEINRQNIFSANIFVKLKKVLVSEKVTESEVRDVCSVIRALVLDDDVRHEYGKAHEHATVIAKSALDVLTGLLPRFKSDKAVTGDIMLTLASLIVRNEFCQDVDDAGGLKFLLDVMIDHPDVEKLNWQALKLLKALAGNDNVKSRIVTSGSAPLIVSVISRLKNSETVVSAGLACISALSLRSPSNAGVFFDCGAPMVIIDAMKAYPKSFNVQQNGSWAIRNMSVRNSMEAKEFIAHGVEDILRASVDTHGEKLENDVKAALRDLGLKVNLKERWTGKGNSLKN